MSKRPLDNEHYTTHVLAYIELMSKHILPLKTLTVLENINRDNLPTQPNPPIDNDTIDNDTIDQSWKNIVDTQKITLVSFGNWAISGECHKWLDCKSIYDAIQSFFDQQIRFFREMMESENRDEGVIIAFLQTEARRVEELRNYLSDFIDKVKNIENKRLKVDR